MVMDPTALMKQKSRSRKSEFCPLLIQMVCIFYFRKINLQHEIIRQAMEFNRNLYVITEAVEVVEATQFEESNMAEGSILTKAYIRMKLQVRLEHEWSMKWTERMCVPFVTVIVVPCN